MSGLLVKQGAFKNIEDVEEYAGWMFELASAESVTNRVHSDQAEECQKDLVPRPDLLFKLGLSDGSDSRLLEKNRAVSGSVCVCVCWLPPYKRRSNICSFCGFCIVHATDICCKLSQLRHLEVSNWLEHCVKPRLQSAAQMTRQTRATAATKVERTDAALPPRDHLPLILSCEAQSKLLTDSSELCSSCGWTVEPIAPALGAEILGPDLSREQTLEELAAIKTALMAHQVIFFRDQQEMTPAVRGCASVYPSHGGRYRILLNSWAVRRALACFVCAQSHTALANHFGKPQLHPAYPHVEVRMWSPSVCIELNGSIIEASRAGLSTNHNS